MKTLTCKMLRKSVALSVVLLALGLVLTAIANSLGTSLLASMLSFTGFSLILLSPVTMLVVSLLTLLPSVKSNLEACNH